MGLWDAYSLGLIESSTYHVFEMAVMDGIDTASMMADRM